ncbi:uncharacterized protein LOC129053347 [Pongo abelii]|uniref:uncharacterized protein LOC129053347 n=1 Tax=Pongo abelii TaxID=9601 RepID=UPI0023E80671|nr:uncharacterized protein LOC129053347 [Pongo abelii]
MYAVKECLLRLHFCSSPPSCCSGRPSLCSREPRRRGGSCSSGGSLLSSFRTHSTPANPVEVVARRAGFVASQASPWPLSRLDGGRTAVPGACAERSSLPRGRPWKQDRRAGDPWTRTHEFGSPEASLQASACKKKKSKGKKRKREDEETQLDIVGIWWTVTKFGEISGTIAIEMDEGTYIHALDNGLFTLGAPHKEEMESHSVVQADLELLASSSSPIGFPKHRDYRSESPLSHMHLLNTWNMSSLKF